MTIIIIILTIIVSIIAFYIPVLFDQLQFNAYAIRNRREWYRFISYGALHADWTHLLVNMLVLYSFGSTVEEGYRYLFATRGPFLYLSLYLGGLLFSTVFDYLKHRNNPNYNAVGASGAVSAIVFTSILFHPTGKIYLFFLPIGIPSVVFGALYLIYSAYMARRAKDSIGHSAHFWGAVFGLAYTVLLKPVLVIYFFDEIRRLFA